MSIRRWLALVLDLVIATYALALVLIVATGGIDLRALSVHQAAKPLLTLMVIIPMRIALGEGSAIVHKTATWLPPSILAAWTRSLDRVRLAGAVFDVAVIVVVTRSVALAIGFIANVLIAPSRARAFEMPFEHHKFAEIFAAWDSGWYFEIARRGYYYSADGQSTIAFFPLYPMLMRAAAWPFGGTDSATWTAGIVISCAAFGLALVAIHRLTQQIFADPEVARRTVLYLAVFPFSIFFTLVYAESVFLLTSVLAISGAYNGRWWRAGAWGALAALARPNGILIALPVVLLALRGQRDGRAMVRRCTPVLLIPLALAGYCAFVYSLSGEPFAWLSSQSQWGYSLGHPPWEQLLKLVGRIEKYGAYDYFFVSNMAPFRLFHGAAALIFLALTPAIFTRLGAAMGGYVLVSLLVPLSSNALEGVGRYAAVLFPAFMLVASARSRMLHESVLIVAPLFFALFVCLWVTLHPIY